MAMEFRLPELGENIESGDVVKILVSVGDTITKDQPVMEIETEKANIEVPSPVSGTIKEIHVREGDKVKIGQQLLTIDEGAEEKEADKVEVKEKEEKKKKKEEKKEAKAEMKEEEEVKEEKEEEKEKVKIKAKEEKEKLIDKPAQKGQQGEVVEFSRSAKTTIESKPSREFAPAAPSVRRLAREIGIDISEVDRKRTRLNSS